MTVFTLRRAAPGDLASVLGLLAEAADWLRGRGIDQWPAGGFPPARITPLIAAGVVYLLLLDQDPAATVSLDGVADPEFWESSDQPEDALYVHKLAVGRHFSGYGLGEALLDWAGLRVVGGGRRWLRLDCSKRNIFLQRYYLRLHFLHVRTVDLPHRASGALFQRSGWIGTCRGAVRIHDISQPGSSVATHGTA